MPEKISTRLDYKLFLLFIPVAYLSYLFHELGHWSVGELLGNDMTYSLNYVSAKSGHFNHPGHEVIVSIGGPAFTIIQALLFLLILNRYRSIYIYPFIFFPLFMRFFALVFGGFSKQDEAGISAQLNIGTYTVAIIVLAILFFIVYRASKMLKFDLKTNAYFFTMSTLSSLLVIGSYTLFL